MASAVPLVLEAGERPQVRVALRQGTADPALAFLFAPDSLTESEEIDPPQADPSDSPAGAESAGDEGNASAGGDRKADAEDEKPDTRRPQALKPMQMLGVDIAAPGGKLPHDFAADIPTAPAGAVLLRCWPSLACHWRASCSRHNPLYFEEVNAERYGYTCGHCMQPWISAAHFFGTIPALPYLMAADCPRECVYTLGHYRPGNCVPWRRHCWPVGVDPVVAEGAAITGMIFLLP